MIKRADYANQTRAPVLLLFVPGVLGVGVGPWHGSGQGGNRSPGHWNVNLRLPSRGSGAVWADMKLGPKPWT